MKTAHTRWLIIVCDKVSFQIAFVGRVIKCKESKNDEFHLVDAKETERRNASRISQRKTATPNESITNRRRSSTSFGCRPAKAPLFRYAFIDNSTKLSSFYNEYISAGVPRVSGGEKKEERSPTEFTDVLTEGQHYLGISMLVYMYSHLRETSRM
jgi:hypothetical protein